MIRRTGGTRPVGGGPRSEFGPTAVPDGPAHLRDGGSAPAPVAVGPGDAGRWRAEDRPRPAAPDPPKTEEAAHDG